MATKLFKLVIESGGICASLLLSITFDALNIWALVRGMLSGEGCPYPTARTQLCSILSCNWESPDGENVPKWWQYCHSADAQARLSGSIKRFQQQALYLVVFGWYYERFCSSFDEKVEALRTISLIAATVAEVTCKAWVANMAVAQCALWLR